MATTVMDICARALRLINAIPPGGTLAGQEATDVLTTLNELIEAWSLEHLLILSISRETFSFTAGTARYSIGSGGNFDTTRPIRIQNCGVILDSGASNTIEYPVEIIRESTKWAQIVTKNTQSTWPSHVFYENSYPLGYLNFWNVPSSSTPQCVLYSEKALTQYTSLTDDVSLAPGYARGLAYNLAVDLAPEYGKEVPPAVAARAVESKADIKAANLAIPELQVDAALLRQSGGGRYRILNDGWL